MPKDIKEEILEKHEEERRELHFEPSFGTLEETKEVKLVASNKLHITISVPAAPPRREYNIFASTPDLSQIASDIRKISFRKWCQLWNKKQKFNPGLILFSLF